MLGDKDVAAVAAKLDPLVDHWLLCTLEGPRALSAAQLREQMGQVRGTKQELGDVAAACARAQQLAQAGDRVLVCGSFHTVGPALQSRRLY
jgi:dihydrofolate synthase/folylpolyglutamate synthase